MQQIAIPLSFPAAMTIFAGIIALFTVPAKAEVPTTKPQTGSVSIGFISGSEQNHATIGLGVGVVPDYEGSDQYRAQAEPQIDVKYAPLIIKGTSVGLAVAELKLAKASVRILVGPLARYRIGRDESDNIALQGLGNISNSVEAGGFMEITVGNWTTDMSVGQDVANGHDGLLATFATKYVTPVQNSMSFSYGLSANWADGDYMQSYFGISAAQSATSAYNTYTADSGIKDAGLQLGVSYELSAHWLLNGQAGYQRLFNDSADSPLVNDVGTANQYQAMAGLSYHF